MLKIWFILKFKVNSNPFKDKKIQNKIQGDALEIFRITLIVEHTIYVSS